MTSIRFRQLVILIADFVLMYAVLYVTLSIRYLAAVDHDLWRNHARPFTAVFLFWIITFYLNGFYDLRLTRNTAAYFRSFFSVLAIDLVIAIGFFYLVNIDSVSPKTNLVLFTSLYGIAFIGWRWFYNRSIGPQFLRMRVAFLGASPEAQELATLLATSPHFGYTVTGIYKFEEINTFRAAMNTTPVDLVIVGADLETLKPHARALYETIFSNVTFVTDMSALFKYNRVGA